MADKLTPKELDAIRAREELEEAEYAAWSELPHDHQYDHVNMELYREACEDRAVLLRHVEALEQQVERLRQQIERHESAIASYRAERDSAERKLERVRELPGKWRSWLIDSSMNGLKRPCDCADELEAALAESGEGK